MIDAFKSTTFSNHKRSKAPPDLYLAGKISHTCWRHNLIPNLRQSRWENGQIVTDQFNYVGPFFVACDHGCYHGPTTHGALGDGNGLCAEPLDDKALVIQRCQQAISKCNLLFAYIDAHQCYGTVAEIERALILNKQVVIVFAPGIASAEKNEFWFVAARAAAVLFDVTETVLPIVFKLILQLVAQGAIR